MKTVMKMQAAAGIYRALSTARKFVGASDSARVVRKGLRWELDLSEGIDLAIFVFGRFESATAKVLKGLVRPGGIVLDIGANIGAHTLPLARLIGSNGMVYAFEPTEYAFGKLKRNLAQNPDLAQRVIAEQIRLTSPGAHPPCEIYSSWKVIGHEPRHEKHLGIAKSTEGGRTTTLDEYWGSMGANRMDFIKLDVDGFEAEVIRGGKRTLGRWQPSICLELSPYVLEERGSSFTELYDLLRECGYKLVDLRNKSSITDSAGRLKARIPDGAGINILAVPDRELSRSSS